MSRFTISKLFAAWTPAHQLPTKKGWYRTRSDALTHSWWNVMAHFDGRDWWEYRPISGTNMTVRHPVRVLQWQGLGLRVTEALALLQANMPATRSARKSYERYAAMLSAPAAIAL